MPKYKLRCLHTNEVIEDKYTLHHTDGALLVTEYSTQLSIDNSKDGMLKYQDWLPNIGLSQRNAGTTTYKANELGAQIGMNNLWVTFHGYWPEKDGM